MSRVTELLHGFVHGRGLNNVKATVNIAVVPAVCWTCRSLCMPLTGMHHLGL